MKIITFHNQLYKLLILLVFPELLAAQVFPVEVLKYSGPPDKFLNIVILGDGYTSTQQDKFMLDATKASNGFLSEEPFKKYRDSINIFAVKVVSNASGAAMNPNNLIDNYFGSSYWSYNIERLLVAWRSNLVLNVLNTNTPFYDEGVIMVNDSKYGGSGGQFAVFSTHTDAIELMLHEFGHSFSDLADEYWAGQQYAAERANMTQVSNPATIKWKNFLYTNGVGIYPHEESPTWYRPHQNCKMRYLNRDFCVVCINKMTTDIKALIKLSPMGKPVSFFVANNIKVIPGAQVSFYDLSSNAPNKWEWTFAGGTPSASNEKNPVVTYNEPGTWSVSLKVTNSNGHNTFTRSNLIAVAGVTNIPDIEFVQSVTVYPNPASEHVTVTLPDHRFSPTNYRLINHAGLSVETGTYTGVLDISHLSKGVYFLQLIDGQNTITKKLVKQ